MKHEAGPAAGAPRFVLRYVALAFVFAIAMFFQVGAIRAILRRAPAAYPGFAPSLSSPVLRIVDSRAVAAGLHPGDILVAINGRPCTGNIVYWEETLNAVPGKPLAVTVRSPGPEAKERTVLLPLTASRSWINESTFFIPIYVVMPFLFLALGFWVVLVRPADRSAWLLLGLLLGFSQSIIGAYGLIGWGPSLVTFTGAYWELMLLLWPVCMFLFGFYFPEPMPVFQRPGTPWRWFPAMVLAPCLVLAVANEVLFVAALTSYSSIEWLHPVVPYVLKIWTACVYLLVSGFFFFIFSKSYREISPDSRRRLRLLAWGASVAMTPALLLTVAVLVTGRTDFPDWLGTIVSVLFVLFPLTLAYVIVVQRAMDVRVVLRQGLQYALARSGLRVLQVSAILSIAVTGLAMIQDRDRPQKLTVIALGLAAIFVIRRGGDRAGDWIDRRFFREAYDAEQVLSELSDSVRSMVEVRSMIEIVATSIARTLHISRVAVLLGGRGPYRPAYALGYGSAPDVTFPPGAGPVKLLEQQNEPARVYFDDPHSWLYREPEVTDDDRAKLSELNAELLLPLGTRDKLLGFISLGPKLSDEPYSRADLRLLKSVAAQTGLALENAQLISAIADEVQQRERLDSEVRIARDVQERLFPQTLPPIAGLEYAGACRPAFGVGGDYYDFLALPGGKLGIAIGDVSGKGIAAALTMASLQASLRSEATRAPDDLAGLMGNVNRLLHQALASNRYATFFYGQYDPAARRLTYVNAGHNPPMLFHACKGDWQVARLEACGTVVGLLEDAAYEQASLPLAPGDMFVAFTDGVSEAMNAGEEEWGEERLIDALQHCHGLPPTETIACIMRAADEFVAGAKQHDDMTIIVLCGQSSSEKEHPGCEPRA